MKITKEKLRTIIKEELLRERGPYAIKQPEGTKPIVKILNAIKKLESPDGSDKVASFKKHKKLAQKYVGEMLSDLQDAKVKGSTRSYGVDW